MRENIMKVNVVQYTDNLIFIQNLSSKLYQWTLKFRLLESQKEILRVANYVMQRKFKVTTTFKLIAI
jgi:hypothetical protein